MTGKHNEVLTQALLTNSKAAEFWSQNAWF